MGGRDGGKNRMNRKYFISSPEIQDAECLQIIATVVAYELSPVPWLVLKIRALLCGLQNLKIIRRNFLKDNLSKATLVVCYLYPGAMEKLSSKFFMELNPKAKVISSTFEIPAWTPTLIQNLEDVMCPQIFHYEMNKAITSFHQFIEILSSIIL